MDRGWAQEELQSSKSWNVLSENPSGRIKAWFFLFGTREREKTIWEKEFRKREWFLKMGPGDLKTLKDHLRFRKSTSFLFPSSASWILYPSLITSFYPTSWMFQCSSFKYYVLKTGFCESSSFHGSLRSSEPLKLFLCFTFFIFGQKNPLQFSSKVNFTFYDLETL